MSFNSLGLSEKLIRSIFEKGYTTPTEIQLQAIPAILKKLDIMGTAQTGTGKTAGFTLPLLHLLNQQTKKQKKRYVRALILTPTRELAAQVDESIKIYGKYLSLQSVAVYGGVNIFSQKKKLRNGIDVLVATPGRLLDHINQKTVDLSKVEILVLDEGDRMLDMGFIHDIRKITDLLPKKRQSLLFSATFSNNVKKLAINILNNPVIIKIKNNPLVSELIEQLIHPVARDLKSKLLSHLINSQNWKQVLVFTRTKIGADKLVKQLKNDGINALAIHSDKSQRARAFALFKFKDYKLQVLVATDIAARGLDIDQLPYVVNFELPDAPEDYIHRIGRTGRAGYTGKAISLVSTHEQKKLRLIQKFISKELPKVIIPGYETTPLKKAKGDRKKRNIYNGKRHFSGNKNKNHFANLKKRKHFNFKRKIKKNI